MGNISQIKIGNITYDIKDKNIKQMGASGSSHSGGLVPDTPSTSGTQKYLREDGTWVIPPDTNTWPTTLSQLTNDTGYITGITSSMVIAALGYTPPSSDTNTVTSINGKTGEIAAADMAAVLTAAGYALTDTNTWPTALSQLSNDVGYITGITSSMVTTALGYTPVATDTNTWRPLGTGADDACAGNDSRLSDSRPASDVYSWAKEANKPSYSYSEIGYTANIASNSSTTLTIDGSIPLHVITTTANITAITFTDGTIPADGHSCHLIITGTSAYTVAINNNATMSTVDNVAYTSVCPEYTNITDLSINANGFVELDLLRVGTKIYIRGV